MIELNCLDCIFFGAINILLFMVLYLFIKEGAKD